MTVHALEAARRLAPRLAARAADHDRDGSFPVDDFADLREAGLFGLMVPRELGGLGATFAEYAAVATELARGNGATALVFNMHASVTGALGAVTEELAEALGVPEEALAARDRLLRAAAEGAWYAVAMSERGAGARLSQLSTVYQPVEGGWHLKGSKTFCSGAGHPDGYLVAARSATDQSVVSQFLVPAGEGLTVEPTWDSLGMRATSSHDLHLDVTVPADRLLGGVEGLALVVAQLMPHWLVASYAAVYVGVARAAIDAAAEHLNARNLAGLPAVRARLGRADAAVAAAELVVAEAARRDRRDLPYFRLPHVGLAGLLHLLRDEPRLQTFVERELGGLLAYDAQHPREQLLGTLRAYLEQGRNKSAAAAAAHLSRPAFYERLARIGRILDVDLDSVEQCLSLHVALLALDAVRTP
ncbi:putative acyl-CoA dehydrogenase YdbM [Micromonospora sp. MH33]|nr:putative acyl-CoA dehydrogenase YdbM [Micromonospora sp. MH33]